MGDNMKKLWLLLLIPFNVYAYSPYIIASGKTTFIEAKLPGVSVVGMYKIDGRYHAKEAGLEVGDLIVSIDDINIDNTKDMIDIIEKSIGDIKIGYLRGNIKSYTNLKLMTKDSIFKTGLYVKDTITGIGTLTYIDPNSKIFGALGHEMNDDDISNGKLYSSEVTSIKKSERNSPGEKRAKEKDKIGDVLENTIHGVFGKYSEVIDGDLYKVASPKEIKKGPAKILTVLDKDNVEAFDINILKFNYKDTTKNILFEVADQNLLEKTGGIIQGMSGSPIIQGEYIVGAVTHVITSNPERGYGIFITTMLEEGEN